MNMEESLHIRAAEETINSLLKEAEDLFQGRDVVIRVGRYRGRRARITSVIVSQGLTEGRLAFLSQPYDARPGRTDQLLWDDDQARTYRPVSHLFLIPSDQRWYLVVLDPANEGAWQVQTPEGFLAFTTESCGPQKRAVAERVAAISNAELCRRMVS